MIADPGPRAAAPAVSVVIPNWNGRGWLEPCLASLAAQDLTPAEVIVVDNGSTDGSVDYLRESHPQVEVLALDHNTGFAHAANLGMGRARNDVVALINADVVLEPDWLSRLAVALAQDPGAASAACKMVSLADPSTIYDAGDILRRDGACEQRGRFTRDDGRFDAPGEVFGACAGAAMYRRSAVRTEGGFDERYFAYLEDVDLALRLRLAGWHCLYVPAVARHAGESTSPQLAGGHQRLVTRNYALLVALWFPPRWLPYVAYRQAGWLWHALRRGNLGVHLRGLAAAAALLPSALRDRRRRRPYPLSVDEAVPARPFRGPRADGYRGHRA
jgi:hypothetical protein